MSDKYFHSIRAGVSKAHRPHLAHGLILSSLKGHSHTHLFTYHLQLLSWARVELRSPDTV